MTLRDVIVVVFRLRCWERPRNSGSVKWIQLKDGERTSSPFISAGSFNGLAEKGKYTKPPYQHVYRALAGRGGGNFGSSTTAFRWRSLIHFRFPWSPRVTRLSPIYLQLHGSLHLTKCTFPLRFQSSYYVLVLFFFLFFHHDCFCSVFF